MLKQTLTIYFKEMKEVLRDRRTLLFMLVLPTLVVPLLFNFMFSFISKAEKKAKTETLTYAVVGAEYLPELADHFENSTGFERVTLSSADQIRPAISEGDIKLAIEITEGVAVGFAEAKQVEIILYYNNASSSSKARERAKTVIEAFNQQIREKRLHALGLQEKTQQASVLEPCRVKVIGTADDREYLGERLGGMLPYLFIIFAFIGALYPAIDLGAGEKERGTLETLLLTPVPRNRLVLGKFMVIFTTGVTAALLSLASITVWLLTKGQQVKGTLGSVISAIETTDMVLIGAMLIPTTAIFAALLMCISIYAKSFKEAQSYATPLNFLIIIPAIMAILPGVELNWKTAMIPITNVSLAIKELIKGTMDYTFLVAILGSSTLIAVMAVLFCSIWFNREEVLFRE